MGYEQDILTVEEAARFLRVDSVTVQRELRRGALPGAKVGRAWRLSRQQLMAYVSGGVDPSVGLQQAIGSARTGDLDEAIRRVVQGALHESVPRCTRAELLRRAALLEEANERTDPDAAATSMVRLDDPNVDFEYIGPSLFGPAHVGRLWNQLVHEFKRVLDERKHRSQARAMATVPAVPKSDT